MCSYGNIQTGGNNSQNGLSWLENESQDKPKMQRRLSISTETYKALKIDMDKLLENSFICDAQYCSNM